eukprot:TRINITY_DN11858_c0_g1_i1.p1 TRINITY_DN11858_c0_g1~~TRINITY_DN11858_c0_g1_i1.p1  ORF type:complete len:457 (-),score=98.17 TRINITY_DN11858_c0_g1_i1:61-1308(-)
MGDASHKKRKVSPPKAKKDSPSSQSSLVKPPARQRESSTDHSKSVTISTSRSPTNSQRTPSISLLPSYLAQHNYHQQTRKEHKASEVVTTITTKVEWEFVPQTQTVEVQLDDKQYILKRSDTVGELLRRIHLATTTTTTTSPKQASSSMLQHRSWLEHIGGKKIDCETELEHALPKATFLHLIVDGGKKQERYSLVRLSPQGFERETKNTANGDGYRTLKKENKRLREEIKLAKQLLDSYQSLINNSSVTISSSTQVGSIKSTSKDNVNNHNNRLISSNDDRLLIDLSSDEEQPSQELTTKTALLKSPPTKAIPTATTTAAKATPQTSKVPASKIASQSSSDRKAFKYVAVVRKKDERDKLKGSECEHCKKWYDALEESGDLKNKAALLNSCSRHKHLHSPPTTPPSFWDLDFPS